MDGDEERTPTDAEQFGDPPRELVKRPYDQNYFHRLDAQSTGQALFVGHILKSAWELRKGQKQPMCRIDWIYESMKGKFGKEMGVIKRYDSYELRTNYHALHIFKTRIRRIIKTLAKFGIVRLEKQSTKHNLHIYMVYMDEDELQRFFGNLKKLLLLRGLEITQVLSLNDPVVERKELPELPEFTDDKTEELTD